MSHIHTAPGQHDSTVSAMIVRSDSSEPRVLFHMHKKIHKLLQPGGHVELHENPWQAVLHEIIEETGYTPEQLVLLQPRDRMKRLSGTKLHPVAVCQNTHLFSSEDTHMHIDTCYAFVASGDPDTRPGSDESQDLRWLTASELAAIPDDQTVINAREIAQYVLSDCFATWERVPLTDFES